MKTGLKYTNQDFDNMKDVELITVLENKIETNSLRGDRYTYSDDKTKLLY